MASSLDNDLEPHVRIHGDVEDKEVVGDHFRSSNVLDATEDHDERALIDGGGPDLANVVTLVAPHIVHGKPLVLLHVEAPHVLVDGTVDALAPD